MNLGHDADTVDAVTGQIAGALYGASGILQRWLAPLACRERIEELADCLVANPRGGKRAALPASAESTRGRPQAAAISPQPHTDYNQGRKSQITSLPRTPTLLHARRIISPPPIGPLSTAELLNPDPRWVRLETLRLLDEFWHILDGGESLRPVFVAFADLLLLSLAATCNTAPHAAEHLPKISLRIASHPDLRRAVTDAMPNETIARAFADLCGTILVDAARHLELAELALSVPTLRMTAYVGALRYLEHDPDLHPCHLRHFHDAVMCRLTGADLARALVVSRQLTDDLTTTVDGPAPFRPFHFDERSGTTGSSSIIRPASGSGEVDGTTILRLTASLRRLQARQAVLRRASDTDSREAVETSDQIGFLFRSITSLKRSARSMGTNPA